MPKKNFVFEFEVNVTLNEDEIWPDGDAPENPTIEDVHTLLKKLYPYFGSKLLLLNDNNEVELRCSDAALDLVKDWNLHDGTFLEIREAQKIPTLEELLSLKNILFPDDSKAPKKSEKKDQ